MSLTFYHSPNSTSNVTAAILAELTHPHASSSSSTPLTVNQIDLSISRRETRSLEYLSVNPNGRVPAIVHEGVSIWESAAITMYLGEMFGVDRDLYPSRSPQRGQAMKWIVWTNTTLTPAGGRLAAALPAGTPGGVEEGSQDAAAAAAAVNSGQAADEARKEIADGLKVLDGALVGREYLLGEEYSLADTHVWCFIEWLGMMGIGLDEFQGVKAWVGRVGRRPALKDL
ncbi:MAG: hypothetical protein LQ342_007635 [Letrouitia transgressa]|nr:MAG: hypothetical protein LQ342_007635 [Letrouitia transgressa]